MIAVTSPSAVRIWLRSSGSASATSRRASRKAASFSLGITHEVFNDEVVLGRVGVLEVLTESTRIVYGICQAASVSSSTAAIVSRSKAAPSGLNDEEEVVVLRVGVLQFFKGLQLRVGLREKHPVVGGKLEL